MGFYVKEESKDKTDGGSGSEPAQPKGFFYDDTQLEEFAHLMRNDIKIQDIASGWFSKELRVTEGKSIYYWIIEHIGKDEKQAKTIC